MNTLSRTVIAIAAAAALTLGWQAATTNSPVGQPRAEGAGAPATAAPTREPHSFPAPSVAQRAYAFALRVRPHARFGTIIIPRLGLRMEVREGISIPAVLDRGVGHYPDTTVPGLGGTVGIPAHRVTPVAGRPYGPFRYINRLRRGDRIVVVMPYGTFRYRVAFHRVVLPADHRLFRNVGHDRVVLSACHPPFSAAYRYLVVADVVGWHD